METEPDLSRWDFATREGDARHKNSEAKTFEAARLAIAVLADIVYRVGRGEVPKDSDTVELRRVALGNVGALAVRASNVAVLLLESGYGIEALAPGRRLLEHQLRAKELYEDETGNAAQRWLAHKKATPMSSLIKANPGAGRLHGVMSRIAHDDTRAIETLYSPPSWVGSPSEKRSINLFPQQMAKPLVSFARLLVEAPCEIAVRIAEVNGETITLPAAVIVVLQEPTGITR
jgi:hypothetical protein